MRFRDWLTENKLMPLDDKRHQGYQMNIQEDEFIHFTTSDRAKQILEAGRLLFKPPHAKFGTDTVDAISLVYGSYLPSVQTTHIDNQDDLVAVRFKTNAIPDAGYSEEVKWLSDVPLINPQIISKEEAIRLLQNTPEKLDEDAYVVYMDPSELEQAVGVPRSDLNKFYDAKAAYYQQINA
jgi:hypothetical protein